MARLIFIPGWAIPPGAYETMTETISVNNSVSVVDYGFFSENAVFDFGKLSFKGFNFPEEDLVLCAHSMGTLLALKYAASLKNVKALVLISPFARFTQTDDYSAQDPLKIDLMRRQLNKNPRKMLESFYSSLSPTADFRMDVPEYLNVELLAEGLEFLKTADFRNLLDAIDIPFLILYGEKDVITQKDMTDYLVKTLNKCDYRIVPGAGHSLPIEKGRGCAVAIEDFFISNKIN